MAVTTTTSRSPRSLRRKTITGTSDGAPHLEHAKKRAHSLAPGAAAALAPLRGILKPRNTDFGPSDNTRSLDTLSLTDVQDVSFRKSMGPRRVSFASHAHVKKFDPKRRMYAGSSSSPTPSPEQSREPPPPATPTQDNDSDDEPSPEHGATSPQHTGSIPPQRRSPFPNQTDDASDGEVSMDLDDDDIGTVSAAPHFLPDDLEEYGEDDDMSLDDAGTYGDGILASRRRSSMLLPNGRRSSRVSSSSRRRSSVAPSGAGSDSMEFTMPLGQTLYQSKPASQVMLQLQSATHSGRLSISVDDEQLGNTLIDSTVDASFSSASSLDGGDADNKTLNLTALTSRRSSAMSIGSVVQDTFLPTTPITSSHRTSTPVPTTPETPAGPPPAHRISTTPLTEPTSFVLQAPPLSHIPRPVTPSNPRRSASPTKPTSAGRPTFTAAFAPRYQPSPQVTPRKRAASVSASDISSPAKRKAVGDGNAPVSRAQTAPPSSSPAKEASTNAKRPLGGRSSILSKTTSTTQPSTMETVIPDIPSSVFAHRTPTAYDDGISSSPAHRTSPVAPSSSPWASTTVAPSGYDSFSSSPVALLVNPPLEEFRRRSLSPIKEMPTPTATVSTVRIYPSLDDKLDSLPSNIGSSPVGSTLADQLARLSTQDRPSTQDWAESVDLHAQPDEVHMSMDDFFAMTDIKFMEQLTCPRYSTALGLAAMSSDNEQRTFQLDKYFKGLAVDLAQLEAYQSMASSLQEWFETAKAHYAEIEAEVLRTPPPLFVDFPRSEDPGPILHFLKLLKTNVLAQAKAEWYSYKMQWVEELQSKGESSLKDLHDDEMRLQQLEERLDNESVHLLQCRDRIVQELAAERATVAEIEAGDQEHLASLKSEIEVQAAELERQRNELSDQEETVAHLRNKLAVREAERKEILRATEDAIRQSAHHRGCTRQGLQIHFDELDALQALHGWRVVQLSPSYVELVFSEKFLVGIPCHQWDAGPDGLSIQLANSVKQGQQATWRKNKFPDATTVMLAAAQRQSVAFIRSLRRCSYGQVVRHMDPMWRAFACIRREIDLLSVRFPVQVKTIDRNTGLCITATVLIHKMQSKAQVSFTFNDEVLIQWPSSAAKIEVGVNIKYGEIQHDDIRIAVQERLATAKLTDPNGHLLESCNDVLARYD